jgi:alpha-amylase
VDYSVFNPFNSQDYFHPYCALTDYTNQTMTEECWMGDDTVCLPDLDTESTNVQTIWYSWIGDLVANYSSKSARHMRTGIGNTN